MEGSVPAGRRRGILSARASDFAFGQSATWAGSSAACAYGASAVFDGERILLGDVGDGTDDYEDGARFDTVGLASRA